MLIVFLYRKSRVLSVWRGNKYFCFLERVFAEGGSWRVTRWVVGPFLV